VQARGASVGGGTQAVGRGANTKENE
jgi:hypothetical protein